MKNKVMLVLPFVGIFIMLYFFGAAVFYANEAGRMQDKVMLALSSPVDTETVASIRSKEQDEDLPVPFTLWEQKENQSVYYKDLGRSATVSAVLLAGNSNLLFPASTVLFSDDKEGCLMDEAASYLLFGDRNPVGKKIQYGGRELAVRGVLKESRNTLVLQAPEKKKAAQEGEKVETETFSQISFGISAELRENEVLEQMSNRYGITGQKMAVSMYQNLAKAAALLLFIFILFALFFRYLKQGWRHRDKPFVMLLYIVIAVLVVLTAVRLSPFDLTLPAGLLPNQWSDFSFYSTVAEENLQAVGQLLVMEKAKPLLYTMQAMGLALFYGIAAGICFLVCRRRVQVKSVRHLFRYLLLFPFISFLVFLLLNMRREMPASTTGLWLLLPFYIIASHFADYLKDSRIFQK